MGADGVGVAVITRPHARQYSPSGKSFPLAQQMQNIGHS
jgi:hypothetical protein